jgi:hypothetical protein
MATKKAEEKALAVKGETGVSTEVLDFGDDAGKGYENQSSDDVQIPFLNVLQGLSPEVVDEDSDLKAGMIFNTVTQEAIKGSDGMVVIPVTTQHVFVEWVPRLKGGGYVATHLPESPVVQKAKAEAVKFGKYTTGENDLVETFYVYALDAATGNYMIIPFTSTKIKPYKSWNSACKLFNHTAYDIPKRPPMFAHRVSLTTEKESRPGGDSYNYRMTPLNPATGLKTDGTFRPAIYNSMIGVKNPMFTEAKHFLKLINEGVASADHSTATQEEGGTKPKAADDDSNVPF